MDLPMTRIDLTGPWQAIAIDPTGYVLNPDDEDDDMADCVTVAVVRRSAAPTEQDPGQGLYRVSSQYDPADVLYEVADLDDDLDRVALVLGYAVAVAEALNSAYPLNPATCRHPWHGAAGEPAGPCPWCGQRPFPFVPEAVEAGTIVTYAGRPIRRRPHTTIGLPWKDRDGTRYTHAEVRALVRAGAPVSFCETCGAGKACVTHDAFAQNPATVAG